MTNHTLNLRVLGKYQQSNYDSTESTVKYVSCNQLPTSKEA